MLEEEDLVVDDDDGNDSDDEEEEEEDVYGLLRDESDSGDEDENVDFHDAVTEVDDLPNVEMGELAIDDGGVDETRADDDDKNDGNEDEDQEEGQDEEAMVADDDEEPNFFEQAMRSREKRKKRMNQRRAKGLTELAPRGEKNEEEGESEHEEKLDVAGVLGEKVSIDSLHEPVAPESILGTTSGDLPPLKKTAKEKRREREQKKMEQSAKAMAAAAMAGREVLVCNVCGMPFASRNKLFEHVKSSGHASAEAGGQAGVSVAGDIRTKKKRR